jgi:hypothetical protein
MVHMTLYIFGHWSLSHIAAARCKGGWETVVSN